MARPVPPRRIHIELLSDTTFPGGDVLAGSVDTEVEHDELGLPFIGGRSLRGLLRNAWRAMERHFPHLYPAAERVLEVGRDLGETGRLRIGDALASEAIRSAVARRRQGTEPLAPQTILKGFTAIRYQAAQDRDTGARVACGARSARVVLRGFPFFADLHWLEDYAPGWDDLRVLALAALATREGGWLHRRGRGQLRLTLDGDLEQTRRYALDNFKK